MTRIKNVLDIYSGIYANWPEIITDNNTPDLEFFALRHDVDITPSDLPTIFFYTEPDILDIFDIFSKELECRPRRLILVNGKTHSINFENTMFAPFNLTNTALANQNILPVRPGPKKYLANALFGGWSRNRAIMFDELVKYDLVDQCLINHRPRQQATSKEYQNCNYVDYQSPAIRDLDHELFSKLAYDNNNKIFTMIVSTSEFASPWISQIVPYNIYNSSYVSLVSETTVSVADIFFVSEKIAKPLLVGQPFLVYGCQYFLQYLKEIGFCTFGNWFDESYDLIEDNDLRARAIVKSLHAFSQLTDSIKQSALKEMAPITEHNRRLILDSKKLLGNLYQSILNFKKF